MSNVDITKLWTAAPRKPVRKTEADLYQMERDFIPGHWTRNESGLIAVGAPDTNVCSGGVEVWVENKVVHGRQIKVRPSQVGWITERCQHGGRCFILALTPDGSEIYLWLGRDASNVKKFGIDYPAVLKAPTADTRTWRRVREHLFKMEHP